MMWDQDLDSQHADQNVSPNVANETAPSQSIKYQFCIVYNVDIVENNRKLIQIAI